MNVRILTLSFLVFTVLFGCKNEPKTITQEQEIETVSNIESPKIKSESSQIKSESAKIDSETSKKYKAIEERKKKYWENNKSSEVSKVETRTNKSDNGIPDPCTFVDAKYLAKKLGASEGHVTKKHGKLVPGAEKHSSSCFWKWNNGGLMIQISTNPMPEEVPNYISKVLTSKKSFGDSNPDNESNSKFINFSGPGTINIKHQESGRYYVSKGDDYMIMIMFQGKKKNYDKIVNELASKIFKTLN